VTQIRRIALVSDFGGAGPYVGQMQLVLSGLAPRIPAAALISNLAPFRPDLAAYLLPGLARDLPSETLYLCVVDPGVGGERGVIALEANGCWYLGPDNGLLSMVERHGRQARVLRIDWRPKNMSNSFHGRDLFAPVAAMLCRGEMPDAVPLRPSSMVGADWPDDLCKVVYVDDYGNLITGVRACALDRDEGLRAAGRQIRCARSFCEVPAGQVFWYENAFGLVEIAVNQGRADLALGIGPGDEVGFPVAITAAAPCR
jgi:S-adenosylmethionine hydrolase